MGLDELMKKLIEDESLKYELSDSSSESCWNEISRAISKKQKFSCRLNRKLYRINSIVPLRDIGFAAVVIALCILVPFGINRYKNSMNQYKQIPGTKIDRNKDKTQNKNKDDEKNNKNNTVDDSQSELERKLYSIVDGVARNKFNKYAIESRNLYILNNDYNFDFIIHEITDKNRMPKEIRCLIDKDNFTVKTEAYDYSSRYEHVEDLINIVEGYKNGFGTQLAYDIPKENAEKIEYYVHQESPDDPNKVFYFYNYDEHTLYRKDKNTGKYKAIYKYELNSNGPMVKHLNADLNSDGINEQVSFDIVSGILSVNNMKMKYSCWYNYYDINYDNIIFITDIDKSDGTKEIILRECLPDDIKVSHIFYYNNGILDFSGAINSVELSIDGDNFIKSKNILYQFFQTWFRNEIFTLDKNHHIKIIPKDFYSLKDYGYSGEKILTVKKEIPIKKDKNSSEIAAILKVGEKVKLLGTDYNQWVLLENSQGVKGWIQVNGHTVKILNTFSGNVFDGLIFAD